MHEQQHQDQLKSNGEDIRHCPSCGLALSTTIDVCPQDGTRLIDPFADAALEHRYKFLSTIASGGMGVVYKAQQLALDKFVAIKMIHSHLLAPNVMQRFHREAKAMALLSHPNIINVIEFGATNSGQPFIVMEFLCGETLADILQKDGTLDINRFSKVFLQTCNGLAHAHANGVLHRDIKPSNIMICRSAEGETIKILDFGIAKLMEYDKAPPLTLTKTGETVGSPQYMSPEQSRGEEADQRSDLYSLGCVMHETLVGVPPFAGKTLLDTMLMHLNETPRSLFEVSGKRFDPKIERMIAKLLAKAPADRYQTVTELQNDLLTINPTRKSGFGGFVVPSSLRTAPQVSTKALIAAGAVTLTILAFWGMKLWYDSTHSPQSAAIETALNSDSVNLDLSEAKLHLRITDIDLEKIKDNPNIQSLNLSNSSITNAAIKTISTLHLTGLNLSGTGVVSLAGIKNVDELRNLDLSKTVINGSALSAIKVMYGLGQLSLKDVAGMPADTLEEFDKLKFLTSLNIEGCPQITLDSIDKFKQDNPRCKVLFTDPAELDAQAKNCASAGDWKTACDLLDQAERIALASHKSELYATLARDKCETLYTAHQFTSAASTCSNEIKAIKSNRNNINIPQIYFLEGMALEGCNRGPEAIPCYHESLSYYLQRKEFTNDTLTALYQAMHDACNLNDTETIKSCTKIADDPRMPQSPDLGSAYSDLGGWLVTHGETRRGIDYLLKAKAIYAHSPNFVAPQNLAGADAWLGRGYKDLGDYAKALELLRHAAYICKEKAILVRAYTDLAEIAKKQSNSQDAALYEEKLKDALNPKGGG